MLPPQIPAEEPERLASLQSLHILDTPPEERFDRITRLASDIFEVPIALVSLIDRERQWFKSRTGLDACETSREVSFCGHAILSDAIFVVEDATRDTRFSDNPLVTGQPSVIFYAGMPLLVHGHRIGTLCLIDHQPRSFGPRQRRLLAGLAVWVERELSGVLEEKAAIENLIARRTEALRESEGRNRAIVENIVDGIININEYGTIDSINPAGERLFGYRADELIGHNVKMLMPEPYQSEHDGYLHNYMHTGVAKVIGIGREVTGRRKDGSTFPMYLAVGEIKNDGQRMFTGIVRDISASKRAERLKNEFISTVSHELRTPLTSIRGSLGLIEGGIAGELPAQVKSLVAIAAKNCDRLVRLINEILDMEKIESGKMKFTLHTQAVMPLVEQAVQANQAFAAEHATHFVITERVADTQAQVDADRFIQVLTNLLSNAAKYSPPDTPVEVSASLAGGEIRIAVRDHGTGIPLDFQANIFQKFSQADGSTARKTGGSGLGLSIAKSIVEHMNGRIGFDSTVGAGTCFWFCLPIDTGSRQAQSQPTAPARILVCEPRPTVGLALRRLLEKAGYDTDIAESTATALSLIGRQRYAALTVDIDLPEAQTGALLDTLRHTPAASHLPVVVVSEKAAQKGVELGGVIALADWLDQPGEEKPLLTTLGQATGASGRPRILHVEDDPDLGRVVKTLLNTLAEVELAATLSEAQRYLQASASAGATRYDLVILDIGLPDGSGLNLLPTVKQLPYPLSVIVFSAHESDPTAADDAAIAAVLVKSRTSNQQLLDIVDRLTRPRNAGEAPPKEPT